MLSHVTILFAKPRPKSIACFPTVLPSSLTHHPLNVINSPLCLAVRCAHRMPSHPVG